MKTIDIESADEHLLKSALEKVEHLPEHRREMQRFRYEDPDLGARPRAITRLCMGDIMCALVQKITKGGETVLHSHTGMDGFYMVLSGRARFYGEGDALVGELGPNEGVYIPREVKYWFESAGGEDEPLHLLQVEAFVRGRENKYTSYGHGKSDEQLADEVTRINFYDAGLPAGSR